MSAHGRVADAYEYIRKHTDAFECIQLAILQGPTVIIRDQYTPHDSSDDKECVISNNICKISNVVY